MMKNLLVQSVIYQDNLHCGIPVIAVSVTDHKSLTPLVAMIEQKIAPAQSR